MKFAEMPMKSRPVKNVGRGWWWDIPFATTLHICLSPPNPVIELAVSKDFPCPFQCITFLTTKKSMNVGKEIKSDKTRPGEWAGCPKMSHWKFMRRSWINLMVCHLLLLWMNSIIFDNFPHRFVSSSWPPATVVWTYWSSYLGSQPNSPPHISPVTCLPHTKMWSDELYRPIVLTLLSLVFVHPFISTSLMTASSQGCIDTPIFHHLSQFV